MWGVSAVLAVGAIVAYIEIPALAREKKRKELWLFAILLLAGTVLDIAVSLQIDIPSPLIWIKKLYAPFIKGA